MTDDVGSNPLIPEFTHVDEAGLLPGIAEPRATCGTLLKAEQLHYNVQFAPLEQQQALLGLALHSKGHPLYFHLTEDAKTLSATTGDHGSTVFTAHLNHEGNYTFTLQDRIDRLPPPDLIHEQAWKNQTEPLPDGYPLSEKFENAHTLISTSQEITTQPNSPYQLSFFCHPHDGSAGQEGLQVFWGEQLLHTLDMSSQDERGFIFSVDAPPGQDKTLLEFVSIGQNNFFQTCISEVHLICTSQQNISLPFHFQVLDQDHVIANDQFMVSITTTPPIELNNQDSYDIVYDQGVYQTIIMVDENPHEAPLTKLNLEPLFNQLAIPEEDRLVQIVQLEENGLPTNVYEVNVTDKHQESSPITVADVQLSFPGGDGGLPVFHRHISIDDGEKSGGEFNI